MIQYASSGSDMPIPGICHYVGTKRYDNHFAAMISKKAERYGIDTLIVKPGLVQTFMVDHVEMPYFSCKPEETSREGLHDLGWTKYTAGSMLHNYLAPFVQYTPEPILHL